MKQAYNEGDYDRTGAVYFNELADRLVQACTALELRYGEAHSARVWTLGIATITEIVARHLSRGYADAAGLDR